MLLLPTSEQGEAGKQEFFERARRFHRGDWINLLEEAAGKGAARRRHGHEDDEEAAAARVLEEAEAKVKLREITRAR
eukprot:11345132-Karenia_brevis.AAC.1